MVTTCQGRVRQSWASPARGIRRRIAHVVTSRAWTRQTQWPRAVWPGASANLLMRYTIAAVEKWRGAAARSRDEECMGRPPAWAMQAKSKNRNVTIMTVFYNTRIPLHAHTASAYSYMYDVPSAVSAGCDCCVLTIESRTICAPQRNDIDCDHLSAATNRRAIAAAACQSFSSPLSWASYTASRIRL